MFGALGFLFAPQVSHVPGLTLACPGCGPTADSLCVKGTF